MLLAVPLATYLVSYVYLALFHGQWWLWSTVVHEGGTLTLLDTTFYASHFLGHVPSLTVIAFVFATWYSAFTNERIAAPRKSWSICALLFVAACLLFSLWHFGSEDTWSYVLQQKQGVARYEAGGSFLLHLPSTLSFFILSPLFIAAILWLLKRDISWRPAKISSLTSAFAVTLIFAMIAAGCACGVREAISDPRYLAHSVREIATFPLIFFPIPLAFWLANVPLRDGGFPRKLIFPLIVLLIIALPLLAYQVFLPLSRGISSLAQHPSFSHDPLPIPYLLASHFFEHVLDTVYFSLVSFALIPPQKS
ncbi:MAG: hypothetical protein H6506_02170 [Calditrichaeota bacterium]|nr:hypothetical protein [Calditrichota bacterium]MCB9367077.1 hypothetical protein [Calditrichota bacterium]MCB9391439.1 hypothetical protein [Calditrichota bacterium]